MGDQGFAAYWKSFCAALEPHHYIPLHKGPPEPTTRRPGRLVARIETASALRVRPGDAARLPVRVVNGGDTRWLSGAAAGWTRVGVRLLRAPGGEAIDPEWHRADLSRDVAPGDEVTVELSLPVLTDPGEYLLVIDLVVEGRAWLSDRGSAPARVRLTVERGQHERKGEDGRGG